MPYELVIAFQVYGLPAPQGSKKHAGGGIMVETNKATLPWRSTVSKAASVFKDGRENLEGKLPLAGPIKADLLFTFPRPVSVQREDHITKPDIDKLTRAVFDSITGILIADDSNINEMIVRKEYGEPGVYIILGGSPHGTKPRKLLKKRDPLD